MDLSEGSGGLINETGYSLVVCAILVLEALSPSAGFDPLAACYATAQPKYPSRLTRYVIATGATNSAKRRANNISSFFMANLLSLANFILPDQGKGIRDCRHVWSFHL
jgi:hypothetical protein